MTIRDIQKELKRLNLEAYVISHGNRFIGQDVLPEEHKLKALCNFSGSAGIAVVTANEAYLLVDGRYELQARLETKADEITVIDEMPRFKSVCELLLKQNIFSVGYDAWSHSVAEMEYLKRRYREMKFVDVGDLMHTDINREIEACQRDVQFAGLSRDEKIALVKEVLLEQKADAYLFTSADSVSWLLNLYAHDLPCTPIVRAYALVSANGETMLFANNLKADISVQNWQKFAEIMAEAENKKILYDAHSAPEKIKQLANKAADLHKVPDICALLKTEKNPAELQGMIDCHIRDGVALVKFFAWLEDNWHGLNEIDVVNKLHDFRAEQKYFFSESFETIAGSGANGAIVHYQPKEHSALTLAENTLLLLDSGGQYFDGTTDVTRTIVLGEPTAEMKTDFTKVLKAHIALAQMRFPQNTSGVKLDIIARSKLWQTGDDYKHGTGHGVACFGNVHEGPISISLSGSDYGFKPNMITSNEPGLYKEGKYGIRIENLQYTTPSPIGDDFLEFRYLTKVPIDKKLIDKYLLDEGEQAWLNKYHEDVYNSLAPYLSESESENKWLKNACSPL